MTMRQDLRDGNWDPTLEPTLDERGVVSLRRSGNGAAKCDALTTMRRRRLPRSLTPCAAPLPAATTLVNKWIIERGGDLVTTFPDGRVVINPGKGERRVLAGSLALLLLNVAAFDARQSAQVAAAEAWFRARGFEIRRLGDDVFQEGAGDALPFGATLVAQSLSARERLNCALNSSGRPTSKAQVGLTAAMRSWLLAVENHDSTLQLPASETSAVSTWYAAPAAPARLGSSGRTTINATAKKCGRAIPQVRNRRARIARRIIPPRCR